MKTIFRPATEAKAGLGAGRHEEASAAGLENGVTRRSMEAAAAGFHYYKTGQTSRLKIPLII